MSKPIREKLEREREDHEETKKEVERQVPLDHTRIPGWVAVHLGPLAPSDEVL